MSDELVVDQAPAGGVSPAPAVPAPASFPAAAPAATPQASPAAPQVPDGYVPSYRLREAREAAAREASTKYTSEMAGVKAELDRYRQQIAALTGVNQPQTTESDTIKQQFFQLFPWAKKLEDRFGDFESLVDKSQDMDAQINHYWTAHGNATMDRLFKLANESVGVPLGEEAKRQLHSSFVGFIQSSPELTSRYATDPSIVDDFWKSFSSAFVDPVRRANSAGIVQRAAGVTRLPQDSPSGAPQSSPAPKLNGLDERAAAAWAEFTTRTGR